MLRYRTDETDDGLSGKEGTFLICSFWLVSALAIDRRGAAGARPDGAAAAGGVAARPVRRGVRRRHRPPPGQLPAGLLTPGDDRGGRPDHPRRAAGRSTEMDALRRDHHRHRCRRRHARRATWPLGQADPAARARRLAAPRAARTGSPGDVFVDSRYISKDTWYDGDGQAVPAPGPLLRRRRHQAYGAALYRCARRTSASCATTTASRRRGRSATTSWSRTTPWPSSSTRCTAPAARIRPSRRRAGPTRTRPSAHEPRIQQLADDLAAVGHHPFHAPCGVMLRRGQRAPQPLHPLPNCDGFPCLVHAKSDAEVLGVRPALEHSNVELQDQHARRSSCGRTPPARTVTEVVVERDGSRESVRADIVVVACGAANSASLLLASASDAHPDGLANGSGQVGRNYMFHQSQAVLALSSEPNPTVFQKTLGVNDYYFAGGGRDYPARQHPDGGQVAGRDVPRREAARDAAGAGMDAGRESPSMRSTSGSQPRTCRWPENRVTLDREGNLHARLHPDQPGSRSGLYERCARCWARSGCTQTI